MSTIGLHVYLYVHDSHFKVDHVVFDFWRGKGTTRQSRFGPFKV